MTAISKLSPEITLVDTPKDVAERALKCFIDDARNSINERGCFNVAISGGHTPERFFELLGETEVAKQIPWEKVQVFWVDERCVGPDAKASNYGLAATTFLNKVPIPPENVHRVSGEECDYNVAVHQYEDTIRSVFEITKGQIPKFDLIVLGMGDDGHIGSLFPNSCALFDTTDLASVVYVMDGGYSRITLTHPVITAANHLLILISGSEKAEILRDVLQEEPDEVKYPVHTLWPILDKVTWLVDNDAGRYLTS